jgi:hypothetical protein
VFAVRRRIPTFFALLLAGASRAGRPRRRGATDRSTSEDHSMADDRQPQDAAAADEGRKAVQRSLDRRGQGGG